MTENERAICAINGAAREKGMSYGQFVSRSTAEELEKITGRRIVILPKKDGKRRRIRHV